MRFLIFLLTIVAVSMSSLALARGEEETTVTFTDALLVLNSGDVLRGDVTRQGERFEVAMAGGGRVWIAKERVIVVVRTLEDAYAYLAARNDSRDSDGHIWMARWCCRQELYTQAQWELESARTIDPDHHALAGLQRRVDTALHPEPTPVITEEATVSSPPPREEEVGQEEASRDLSPEALRMFTRTVQPILLNGCATNACHGPRGPSEWRLRVPLDGTTPTQRLTRHNLEAVLAILDEAHPEASRLITAPSAPHGGLDAAVFSDREQNQRESLLEWVWLVAEKTPPPTVDAQASELADVPLLEGPVEPPSLPDNSNLPPPESADLPRDPFDPALFNSGRDRTD